MESVSGEVYPVEWSRKLEEGIEEKLEKDGRIEIFSKNKKLFLRINDATIEDTGLYCVTIGDYYRVKTHAKLTVNEIPVSFKESLKDQKGKEGDSVTFECKINRSDKTAKWLVNGTLVDTSSGKYSVSQDKTRLYLTINDLDLLSDDDCTVSCLVDEKINSTAKLKVVEDKIKFIEKLADLGAKENESVRFNCKLNKSKYLKGKSQDLNIKWFINGKEIQNDQRSICEQVYNSLSLEIMSVRYQDAGEIQCQVNDDIFTTATLSVEEEPIVFVKKLADIKCTKIPGQATFECELNKTFSDVVWLKNEIELPRSYKYVAAHDRKVHTLTINDVDGKDEGEYTVLLRGKYEKKCSSTLSVRSAPSIHLSSDFNDNIVIKRGQQLEIEVNYVGFPEPTAIWSFNDNELIVDNRMRIENFKNKNVSLSVMKTTHLDSGKYVLILENECGRDKCTINVKVLDRPGSPRNLEVTNISG